MIQTHTVHTGNFFPERDVGKRTRKKKNLLASRVKFSLYFF